MHILMMMLMGVAAFLLGVSTSHALRKFPSPPPASEYCVVSNVTCQPMTSTDRYCLTTHLTYTHTATIFTGMDNMTQNLASLKMWKALRSVPECWAVVQPFLCSVYLPRCRHGVVERSSSEMCQAAVKACSVVARHGGWPEFLQCEALHFQPGCYPLAARQKYNRTSICLPPLVRTSNPSSFYAGVKGCGLQCQNPAYSKTEHKTVHIFVGIIGTVCLLCTLFAVVTFIIDWKVASKYPSLVLFFINVCFMLGTIGWLLQFSGIRESIVCRQDGAVRIDEPRTNDGQGPWCTVVFFIIYFFMMSGVMWFVVLTFSWYVNFQTLGAQEQNDQSRGTYVHMMAWALPLVLTIVTIAISHIEGDSMSGICFVGYYNRGIRAGLVLTPVAVALILGMYFLIKGLLILIQIKQGCPSSISTRATEKIQYTIIRMTVFIIVASILAFTTFVIHIYIFSNYHQWEESMKDYLVCLAKRSVLNGTISEKCRLSSRQSLFAIQMNILSYFGAGIAMSAWVWTGATYRTWSRFLRSKLNMLPPRDRQDKREKQKRIAHVFGTRRLDQDVVSTTAAESIVDDSFAGVSVASTHEDPVGLDIDVFSASSRPASRAAMRQRLSRRRRPALRHRRHSDSDAQSVTSYMSRRLSAESLHVPESRHRHGFYSRGDQGLDVRQWARHAAKWTKKTKVKPIPAPITKFHKQQIKLHKRHEAAMERAARNSEVSSVISDGASEISSAVFDRNLPLPPIGGAGEARSKRPDYSIFMASSFAPGQLRRLSDPLVRGKPDQQSMAPSEPVAMAMADPLTRDLPDVVDTIVQPLGRADTGYCTEALPSDRGQHSLQKPPNSAEQKDNRVPSAEPLEFKRPTDRLSVVDFDDSEDDISVLEM